MKRTRSNKIPSDILTADWHLREDTPTCFTGDFQKEQWVAIKFISDLQKKYGCPVRHAGDLFHHWKPSPWLLSQTIKYIPDQFYTVYGQHDLPQHNLGLSHKSGIHTLEQAGKLTILEGGGHYGETPPKMDHILKRYNFLTNTSAVLVWHHLTYIQKPYPGASGGMAEGLLRKYPEYSLIVTGDNHTSFTVEYEGRRLVNPGNLTRQAADQIDYQPRVALWYAEDNSIRWVNLPMQENVISREHIKHKEERDKRIEAFINKLKDDWEAELSFEDNLEIFFKQNDTPDSIKRIIYKITE